MSAFSNWQLSILPGRFQPSTFDVYGLNYCVRYGNRWNPIAIATRLFADRNAIHGALGIRPIRGRQVNIPKVCSLKTSQKKVFRILFVS